MEKMNQQKFIEKSNLKHNNKYDYSHVEYINSQTKVSITCPIHGEFLQSPSSHINNHGCKKCQRDQQVKRTSKTTNDFIIEAQKIHGDNYDYHKVNYINNKVKVIIICKKHGEFLQTPSNHLGNHGCPKCQRDQQVKRTSKTTNDFIIEAQKIHGDNYDYHKVNYVNNRVKVIIICKKHGEFLQTPKCHNRGRGCPICKYEKRVSEAEKQWLNYLNIKDDKYHRQVFLHFPNRIICVDGFDPITNTVYEFNGDYYHGNPHKYKMDQINPTCNKTYGELYQDTIERENLIKSNGYNLITIWESEFKKLYKQTY